MTANPILAPHVAGTRIHMTFAPGKKGRGSLSGTLHNRDLDTDLLRLRSTYGTTHLVTLVEDFELDMLQIPNLSEKTLEHQMQHLRFPIVDLGIPSDASSFKAFVEDLKNLYQSGATFTVHCVGGLGRTGLLTAILLQELHGYSPQDSVKAVREARTGTIQTREQEQFVLDWKTS